MSAPRGRIIIDWRQAMRPNSPSAELEVVASSTPPVTTHPPAAARLDTDFSSEGGEYGDAAEFAGFTDKNLQDTINRWRGNTLDLKDDGEKIRRRVNRMKRELERRRVDRQRKVRDAQSFRVCVSDDTVWRQAVQAKSTSGNGEDVYDYKSDDDILDSTAGKCCKNSSYTSSTKTYTQVKAAAYKERSSLSHGKCAYPKKDGQIAKICECLPKNTDCELINIDIDRRKKSTLRSCSRNAQKNNTADSKGVGSKFLEEGATFGSNIRCNPAKNKASAFFKKDVVLLDDDDDDAEPARSADVEISNERDESKIYYPSRSDPEAVDLTYSDMKCLEPEEYLKSPVINFCLQYLKKSRPRLDFYMFNTYFYSKLEEALSTKGDCDSQFSKLRRWWRSVDIFKKAYIILPINESMHWSLIIVCMPTKGADSGPTILHLDSLGLHCSQKLFGIVERYLEAEWRHLRKDSSYDVPFSGMIWKHLLRNINMEKVEVPRQRNDYDCGLFMLYYIDKFIQEAPERLTKESLGMFGRKWFNHEEASRLRVKIQAVLFDLFHSAHGDDGPSEPEWKSRRSF
ncbi:Ubiquitin-like-specific protease 1D [Dichanthelium oligosanthes]|uniref:Ubiquitin-like-specific protease 1D n=1 Tax=Dichanthelium oligosanthes TaxID=888268 RepID=A0A1E5V5V8_9POAL|nr:Ubiquitin-like-specific protease 1D [Dichanthelium oligosanthes]